MTAHYLIKSAIAAIVLSWQITMSVKADTYTAEHIKADFMQLYTELQQAHYDLYANISREQYDKHFAEFISCSSSALRFV